MTKESLQSIPLEELVALAREEGYEELGVADRAALTEFILENLKDRAREKEEENCPSVQVEESKYLMAAAEPSAGSSPDLYPIPNRYNQTKIVFVVRDPHWAFAYWEVGNRRSETLSAKDEAHHLVLRVHELDSIYSPGSSVRFSFDIPVQPSDSSWYIYLPNQDCCYVLELGFVAEEKYTCLVKSNTLRTPREGISASQGSVADPLSEFEAEYMGGGSEGIPQRILAAGRE